MTMVSFRVDDGEALDAQRWAERLGVDKSQLLRDAWHQHLVRLASEHDADAWERLPHSDDELALAAAAEWGPAEGWADWADAAR